jgi:predicted CoA-substrate-specific enzyme activase
MKNNSDNYFAGVDIGSAYAKAVIISGSEIAGWAVVPSGNSYRAAAGTVLESALKSASLNPEQVSCTAATGAGAASVPGTDQIVNEITVQGRAVNFLYPAVRTAIDIGAQFSRVFRVEASGSVSNFVVSEKCAAGSGRLLQVLARVLQVDIKDLGDLSLKSTKRIDFTTNCAVFIESEVISRIAEGNSREDIIAGVQRSLAAKVRVLAERVGLVPDFAFVGGGANNRGLVMSIEEILQARVYIPPQPQIVAALGAALVAQSSKNKN